MKKKPLEANIDNLIKSMDAKAMRILEGKATPSDINAFNSVGKWIAVKLKVKDDDWGKELNNNNEEETFDE